ncbi:class I SAM-dependent RNA methyltransferase [Gracilinema caldarium]|uniref:class I SAM-dependent RNA methyltransferase n=1 Tax=Gracilinema caldarium TaxID=215591 RepID=UPI0026EF3A12|nr:methyltransferase [Gracilinema caldarium]
MAIGEKVSGSIESIAAGGAGILRWQGKTVFIDYTAPGDMVSAVIEEETPSWARASLLKVQEASPHRVESPCPYYQRCGGCTLQHISYETQLVIKKQLLVDHFKRIGTIEELPSINIIGSEPYGYRNRMQFHRVMKPKSGQSRVGLKERASEAVIPIETCPIADPGIQEALGQKNLVPPPSLDRFTVYSREGILLQEGKQQRGTVRLLGAPLIMDAGVFFQSNGQVLERLLKAVHSVAEEADTSLPAADLYCGVGTFAYVLQDLFPALDLMEENPKALNLAKQNIRNGSARFFPTSDEHWAKQAVKKTKEYHYGFMVLDPPRQGLSPALRDFLAHAGPPLIAYVSCDPVTQARDCKDLVKAGYHLETLDLYDFYPQTAHMESLAVLRRV